MLAKTITLPGQPAFSAVAATPQTYYLPLGYLYRAIYVYVYALANGGSGAAPTLTEDGQQRVLSRIRLRTGKDVPWDISGRMLGHAMSLEDGVAFDYVSVLAAGASGSSMRASYCLSMEDKFAHPNIKHSTLLKGWGCSKLELEVTPLSVLTEWLTGGTAPALESLTVVVKADVFECTKAERAHYDAKLRDLLRVTEHPIDTVAAALTTPRMVNNKDLNRGNMTLRAVLMALDGSTPPVRSDAIVNSMEFIDRDNPVLAQTDAYSHQFRTTEKLRYNPVAGLYLLDLDGAHAHVTPPISDPNMSHGIKWGSAAAGSALVVQTELASAQYEK